MPEPVIVVEDDDAAADGKEELKARLELLEESERLRRLLEALSSTNTNLQGQLAETISMVEMMAGLSVAQGEESANSTAAPPPSGALAGLVTPPAPQGAAMPQFAVSKRFASRELSRFSDASSTAASTPPGSEPTSRKSSLKDGSIPLPAHLAASAALPSAATVGAGACHDDEAARGRVKFVRSVVDELEARFSSSNGGGSGDALLPRAIQHAHQRLRDSIEEDDGSFG